ncbi:MAG: hypothetical protein NTY93_03060, partial [Candidatus Kaiserbacteria bacterium]|nr:hypothetical protein [Candidatus Kaiserbacteria bacterium]
ILKPLNPLVVAVEENAMSPETAFLTQVVVFYFLFLVACYFFGRAFGLAKKESVLLVLILGASYPILKYGVDLYTETGALFFYVLSLALTLWYMRAPGKHVLLANAIVLAIGFLWKEYSAVSALIFGLAILFHPELSRRAKFKDFAILVGLFCVVNLAWQVIVYFQYHYTYLSWYQTAGASGFKSQFTVKNIVKSVGALLGLAWLLVPSGMLHFPTLAEWQKRFLILTIPVSFMAFLWGNVSSRLFFVMAPAFALFAVLTLARIKNSYLRYGILLLILAGNIVWLVLSGRVTI